jgi:hypothetical protein
VACLDPTFVTEGEVPLSVGYPPDSVIPEGARDVEYTGTPFDIAQGIYVLAIGGIDIIQATTNPSQFVTGTASYSVHKNQFGFYTVLDSFTVGNSTRSNVSVIGFLADPYRGRPPSNVIGPGQGTRFLLPENKVQATQVQIYISHPRGTITIEASFLDWFR